MAVSKVSKQRNKGGAIKEHQDALCTWNTHGSVLPWCGDHAPWSCVLCSVFNVSDVLGFASKIAPTCAATLGSQLVIPTWEAVGTLRSGAWLAEVGY